MLKHQLFYYVIKLLRGCWECVCYSTIYSETSKLCPKNQLNEVRYWHNPENFSSKLDPEENLNTGSFVVTYSDKD